ncbi:MAG: SusD/RagB family nutrient-binding outer membrane lipoprotein [Bacteroidales bacterium]|nr:SusD/RagB family nutrient-binding outer membrane lipoprotein [Bacteroidales bacterium]
MKKIFSIALAGIAFASSLVSCSDADYDEKYADPSTTSRVGVAQVFTAVMYKANTWMNPIYYRYYCQSTTSGLFAGITGDNNNKGRFVGAGESRYNDRWKNFYDMLTQYRVLESTYANLSDAEKANNEVFVHLSRALVYSQLHEMLSLFGDVPFTGAGTLWQSGNYEEAKSLCVYDDDVALYKQILSGLKESADYLATGNINAAATVALASQDYTMAAGDKTIWQKYVNSLRLRIALHLATNGDCASEAQNVIAEILNNPSKYPVIESNSEIMGVVPDTQKDDFNFGKSLSQALHSGSGQYGSVSAAILRALNVPANGIPDANVDPRLQVMCDCNPDGEYIAYDVTKTNAEISNIGSEKNKEYAERKLTGANYYCVVDSQAIVGRGEYQGNENILGVWISAAEVSLSKAEAYLMGYGVAKDAAKAKECFVKGVKQSTEFYWNLKKNSSLYAGNNDSYAAYRPLVEPTADEVDAYIESIWKPTQETVCTQLWLNFFVTNELEAWNVTRRTGYPVVTFSRDTQQAAYPTPPGRLPYPSDELTYNSVNCQAAITTNYKESTGYYTTLFWAKDKYYKMLGE